MHVCTDGQPRACAISDAQTMPGRDVCKSPQARRVTRHVSVVTMLAGTGGTGRGRGYTKMGILVVYSSRRNGTSAVDH